MANEVITREYARLIDSLAQSRYCIPSLVLMENAGAGSAAIVMRMLQDMKPPHSVVVVTGKGNNGGDGFVVARHLHNKGVFVLVLGVQVKEVLPEPAPTMSPTAMIGKEIKIKALERHGLELPEPPLSDYAINLKIIKNMGIKHLELGTDLPIPAMSNFLKDTDIVVDALLGTGTIGAPRDPYDEIIRCINASGKPVVSLDNPSGFDVNTGTPPGECVRATVTATFAASKVGFHLTEAKAWCGSIEVVDISMPIELLKGLQA